MTPTPSTAHQLPSPETLDAISHILDQLAAVFETTTPKPRLSSVSDITELIPTSLWGQTDGFAIVASVTGAFGLFSPFGFFDYLASIESDDAHEFVEMLDSHLRTAFQIAPIEVDNRSPFDSLVGAEFAPSIDSIRAFWILGTNQQTFPAGKFLEGPEIREPLALEQHWDAISEDHTI